MVSSSTRNKLIANSLPMSIRPVIRSRKRFDMTDNEEKKNRR